MTEDERIAEMHREFENWDDTQTNLTLAEWMYSKGYRKVERSEWIEGCGYNVCSKCGGEVARYDDGDYYQDFAFCPNCGADMRGEKDENNR